MSMKIKKRRVYTAATLRRDGYQFPQRCNTCGAEGAQRKFVRRAAKDAVGFFYACELCGLGAFPVSASEKIKGSAE